MKMGGRKFISCFVLCCFFQVHNGAEERAHVGVTANSISLAALDAAEKLGVDLASLLLSKGAKDILTMARQLNNV